MKISHLLLIPILLISCNSTNNLAINTKEPLLEHTTHLQDSKLAPFYHGVASGDPYQNSIVLWTRVTPKEKLVDLKVYWEISRDEQFVKIANSGFYMTDETRDYTVKVVANKLNPGEKYFYRFSSLNAYSQIGQTKTASATNEKINLGVVSCSNIEFGYFNGYAALAEEDVDAILHLGDYIYEYGPDKYGDKDFFRKNIPAKEIITLQDYRDRYAQYRLDKDLQKAHARHPFINIWDDHEISNNAYVDGAQNHQDNEGDYHTRKEIAKQVYYEWLPIREGVNHYRKFDFGKNLEIFMLDERLAGRTVQPDSLTDPKRSAPENALLGQQQMEWLISNLKNSEAKWKIIGNQVTFSYCDWGYESFGLNMDDWNGYPREQAQLTDAIRENNLKDVVFVTGDTHTAWAFEAVNDPFNAYQPNSAKGAVGVEFGVTSITSANANERYADSLVIAHENKITNSKINPHLKYVNMRDHGYLTLHIDGDELRAMYKVVPTIKTPTSETILDKSFLLHSGNPKLIQVTN